MSTLILSKEANCGDPVTVVVAVDQPTKFVFQQPTGGTGVVRIQFDGIFVATLRGADHVNEYDAWAAGDYTVTIQGHCNGGEVYTEPLLQSTPLETPFNADVEIDCASNTSNESVDARVSLVGAERPIPTRVVEDCVTADSTTTDFFNVSGSGAGTVAAGFQKVSISNLGPGVGTVHGNDLAVGQTVTFEAYYDPVARLFRRLDEIPYDDGGAGPVTTLSIATTL